MEKSVLYDAHKSARPSVLADLASLTCFCQGWALKVCWLWQDAIDPDKPWQGLPLPVDKQVKALFMASTTTNIGCGTKICFWHDH